MNDLWRALSLRAVRGTLLWNFALTFVVLTIGYVIMHFGIEKRMIGYVTEDLKENLAFVARPLENHSLRQAVTWCKDIPRYRGKRFTVIDHSGEVLCDTHADIESLVNHADRPEFIKAIHDGFGESARLSTTRDQLMVYASKRLTDPQTKLDYVLRMALPQGGLAYYLGKMRSLIISNLLGVLVILVIIFFWSSFRVASPLAALERKLRLFRPFSDESGTVPETRDEWEKVDLTVDQIYRDLHHKMDEIARSNDKIATIIESIADGLLAIESNEKILLANNTFTKAFECDSPESITKRPLLEIIRNVDVRLAYRQAMSTRRPVIYQFQQAQTTFELRVYPLFAGGNSLMGAVGIFHNVTEAQLLQKMREDFVANVSHEVRTPLTAIKGYAQILTDLGPNDEAQYANYAKKIEHNVNRLGSLFQDILSLSVLESRKEVVKEEVDAAELIQTVISNVKLTHQDKDIKVETTIETETIWVEPRLFEQVLTNLLDNACKYAGENPIIKLSVTTKQQQDVITISDNGPGIPKESLKRVFERFYRVDSSRAREVGGTGLGLAIVKHAVSKHRGSVHVESEGQGANFIVKIPSKPLT